MTRFQSNDFIWCIWKNATKSSAPKFDLTDFFSGIQQCKFSVVLKFVRLHDCAFPKYRIFSQLDVLGYFTMVIKFFKTQIEERKN